MSMLEQHLQAECVAWFSQTYPHLRGCLFAVPNGDKRDPVTQSKLITQGLMPGIPDLILIVRSRAIGIEIKRQGGKQSTRQDAIQKRWEEVGNTYALVDNFDDFVAIVENFLKINIA